MKKALNNIFSRNRPIGDFRQKINDREYFDKDDRDFDVITHKSPIVNLGVVLAILFFVVLLSRLFFLQVEEGIENNRIAEGNRTRNILTPAPRGMIVDEKDRALVKNDYSYQLVCHINKKRDLDKVDDSLFALIDIPREEVWKQISNSDYTGNVVLKEKIEKDEALILKKSLILFQDFEITPMFIRTYPYRNLSHLLGYIGKISPKEVEDRPSLIVNKMTGKSGIEEAYDEYLQGEPGSQKSEVDASGKLIRYLSEQDAKVGATVKTSINLDLQNFVSEKLSQVASEMKTNAVAVVMDTRNGAIKAMVSIPDYDNSKMSGGISNEEYQELLSDKSNPLLNRAIAGEYPSGSTIKPFIASTALFEKVVDDKIAFDTPAKIELGQWSFPDWKDHGMTDIRTAIAESNNIFFYALGGGWGPIKNGLGPERIKNGLEKFGFGKILGIDLIGERSGFLPTKEWKKEATGEEWYIGNTYNLSIGQGDLNVTPLQITAATASIANGGTLYRPHLISEIKKEDELISSFSDSDFVISKEVMPRDTIRIVQEGMRQTVTSGSARSPFANNFPVSVAAKTGTAQFGNEDKTHAWFISYAPYENPEIAVTVLVEGAGEGSRVSAPIASDIIRWWSEHRG
ncbi:MAG: Stage V sporulation protein D [candidate division WS2 bacterium ADurb.Bin280]|uniref:Stage V sporulation protein D n=1 Tax=candidate division WS2 bacterium ADurb.Bin280 TaxID=1852829 RepID=A0A1V5SDK9_9BACT|nr:MAG: Stage V sporulation protein D [candidate division WS2 bacterium ADurb.Bin280]